MLKGQKCRHCDYVLRHDYQTPFYRDCAAHGDPSSVPQRPSGISPPTLAQEAWNYTQAVKMWRNAGYPARTSEEIARLLAICEACPHYKADGLRKHCGLCGCTCNSSEWGLVNKLAMATETCPEKRW